jgi:hypothetical protein
MLLTQAKEIMDDVRRFFAEGHKSCNKEYHKGLRGKVDVLEMARLSTKKPKRPVERTQNSDLSLKHRLRSGQDYETYEQLAEALIKMPPAHRSGNCLEMAVLSARWVKERRYADPVRMYIVRVQKPGDHVFFLVEEYEGYKKLKGEYRQLSQFVASRAAPTCTIIDPWLHVACTGDKYLVESGKTLQKWASTGKRVYWEGPRGPGWYPPIGPYSTDFVNAPLDIYPIY